MILILFEDQESKSSVKDEGSSASKVAQTPKGTPASSVKSGSTSSTGPVTEDEIRAVLLQKAPVTTQDLVAKFKARLKSQEVCPPI